MTGPKSPNLTRTGDIKVLCQPGLPAFSFRSKSFCVILCQPPGLKPSNVSQVSS